MGLCIFLRSVHLNIINIYSSGLVVAEPMKVYQYLPRWSHILGDFNLHHPTWGYLVSSCANECFVEWLSESSFCLMNSTAPTHVSPNRVCSLIYLSLCSPDLACSSLVEEDSYDSGYFPIIISVDFHSPVRSCSSLYQWSLICREINSNLQ